MVTVVPSTPSRDDVYPVIVLNRIAIGITVKIRKKLVSRLRSRSG